MFSSAVLWYGVGVVLLDIVKQWGGNAVLVLTVSLAARVHCVRQSGWRCVAVIGRSATCGSTFKKNMNLINRDPQWPFRCLTDHYCNDVLSPTPSFRAVAEQRQAHRSPRHYRRPERWGEQSSLSSSANGALSRAVHYLPYFQRFPLDIIHTKAILDDMECSDWRNTLLALKKIMCIDTWSKWNPPIHFLNHFWSWFGGGGGEPFWTV